MTKTQEMILNKSINHGGIVLFSKENGIEFINICRIEQNEILGIDAFQLIGENIRPDLENSIDYTDFYHKNNVPINVYDEAISFLKMKSNAFYFEIVYDNCSSSLE
jgi:hypothetical protein